MSLQQKIIEKINSEYNLGTCLSVQENNVGRQTHYILETVKGRYFIKVLNCKNTNIHKEDEIIACNTLRKKGLNIVPQYIPRKDNTYLTQIEEKIYFNVQSFINGQTWKKYSAPFWLLIAGAELIADIHCLLQGNSLKQRTAIQNINKTDISLNRLDEIEKKYKMLIAIALLPQ